MVSKIFAFVIFLFSSVMHGSSTDKPDDLASKIKKVSSMYKKYAVLLGDIKIIGPKELHDNANSFVIVDVRESKEYEISMLPNAITHSEFIKNKATYKKNKIVLYCTIGYRSGKMIKKIRKEGYDAYNLKGSILLWVLNGYSVYKNKKEVKEVHVYGASWNILPKGYKGIW